MRVSLVSVLADARQVLLPRELRIGRPVVSVPVERLLHAIEQITDAMARASKTGVEHSVPRTHEQPTETSAGAAEELQRRMRFLAEVGTGLWRMRRNMVQPGHPLRDAPPKDEMRKPFRWLVSAWDTLQQAGIEIQDHTGDDYLPGQSLTAHFEPAADRPDNTVVETIKPTIYFDQRVIQLGEVIVSAADLDHITHTSRAAQS
jgi:hypothetical protein